MTDDHGIAGLDPFDLMDEEAARLDRFFSGLDDASWERPSRCEGWTTRDVLGHLASDENYFRANLDGTVQAFIAGFGARGATDLTAANALGVADFGAMSTDEVISYWRTVGGENRRRWRELGDGTVDTSVGDYPSRWQAFHVAAELATHADDVGVPVTEDERAARRGWRTPFSRFALSESKPELSITVVGSRTVVSDGSLTVEVDDDELIEGVMSRLDESSRLDEAGRSMLATTP